MKRLLVVLALMLVACKEDAPTPLGLAADPAHLTPVSATELKASIGDAVPVEVRVTDVDGLPVPAVEVTFTPSTGAATKDSTDAAGLASTSWAVPEAGLATLTASAPGLVSVEFHASVSPVEGQIVFRFLDAGGYHACGI